MSDKMTCPACDSHTSDVWRSYHEGAGCPHCGLPGEAMRAIEVARERGANEQLTERAARAERRATATRPGGAVFAATALPYMREAIARAERVELFGARARACGFTDEQWADQLQRVNEWAPTRWWPVDAPQMALHLLTEVGEPVNPEHARWWEA